MTDFGDIGLDEDSAVRYSDKSMGIPEGLTIWALGEFPKPCEISGYSGSGRKGGPFKGRTKMPPSISVNRESERESVSRGRLPVRHQFLDVARYRLRPSRRKKKPAPQCWDRLRDFRAVVWFLVLAGYSPSFLRSFFLTELPNVFPNLSYWGVRTSVEKAYEQALAGALILDSEFADTLEDYKAGPWAHDAPDWLRAQYGVVCKDSGKGSGDSGLKEGGQAVEPASGLGLVSGSVSPGGNPGGRSLEDFQKETQFLESWNKYRLAVPGTADLTVEEFTLGVRDGLSAVLMGRQSKVVSGGVGSLVPGLVAEPVVPAAGSAGLAPEGAVPEGVAPVGSVSSPGVVVRSPGSPGAGLDSVDRITLFLDEVLRLEAFLGRPLNLTGLEMKDGLEVGLLTVLSRHPSMLLGSADSPALGVSPGVAPGVASEVPVSGGRAPVVVSPGVVSPSVVPAQGVVSSEKVPVKNPEVISPGISPGVVSPGVVSPEVSPEVVSPKVVSPEVVSPKVVSPKVVSPEVVSLPVVPAQEVISLEKVPVEEVVSPEVVSPGKVPGAKVPEVNVSVETPDIFSAEKVTPLPAGMKLGPDDETAVVVLRKGEPGALRCGDYFAPGYPTPLGDLSNKRVTRLSPVPEVWVLDPDRGGRERSPFVMGLGDAAPFLVESWDAKRYGPWVLEESHGLGLRKHYFGKNPKREIHFRDTIFKLKFPKLESAPKDWDGFRNLEISQARDCFNEWSAIGDADCILPTPELLDMVERGMGPKYWGMESRFLIQWMLGLAFGDVLDMGSMPTPNGMHRHIPFAAVLTPDLAAELWKQSYGNCQMWRSLHPLYLETLAPRNQEENLPGHLWVTGMGYIKEELAHKILEVVRLGVPESHPFFGNLTRNTGYVTLANWALDVSRRLLKRLWFPENAVFEGVPVGGFCDMWAPSMCEPVYRDRDIARNPASCFFLSDYGLGSRAFFTKHEWFTPEFFADRKNQMPVWDRLHESEILMSMLETVPLKIHAFSLLAVTFYLRYLEQSFPRVTYGKKNIPCYGYRLPDSLRIPDDKIADPWDYFGSLMRLNVAHGNSEKVWGTGKIDRAIKATKGYGKQGPDTREKIEA